MRRKPLIFLAFAILIGILYLLARPYVSLESLIEQETRLRAAIDAHPISGFIVGFAAYLAISLVPGTGGKAVVVGWLFGFWRGLVIVNLGLTVVAIATFYASRYVFTDMVRSRFRGLLLSIDRGLRREGVYYLFAARVVHAPFSVTNYVMGVTRVRARSFWWATQLGILPGNVLFVFAGDQMPSLRQLADEGVLSFLSPGLIAALVALSVLPLLAQYAVRRLRRRRTPSVIESE